MAFLAAEAAKEKKAKDIVVLDLQKVSLIADYFLICTGTSALHVGAVADYIKEIMALQGIPLLRREGKPAAGWVILDYGGLVIHIFRETERSFYALERLWADANPLFLAAEEA